MFHIQAGFEALITVDNASLPEYQVAMSEDGNTVTCWIPSEEGKVRVYLLLNRGSTSRLNQHNSEVCGEMGGPKNGSRCGYNWVSICGWSSSG